MRRVDCLIVGCGAAGLSAGIEFIENRSEEEECLIIGSQLTNSSLSPWNMRIPDRDTIEEKMIQGGDGLGSENLRNTYLDNYSDAKKFMERIGLSFEESNLGIIPEEEQSALRKFHSYYEEELEGEIQDQKVQNLLLNDKNEIIGVRTQEEDFLAEKLVLAAGGMTNLFEYSSGFQSKSLANILALSLDAGLEVDNLEFMMYHPFLVVDEKLPNALISGKILQNARFLNEDGEEFLSDEIQKALRNNNHHDKFSKMTREFYRESMRSDLAVDISEIDEERFEKFKKENEYGWVFRGKKLEEVEQFKINPTFHYSLGGLVTDENSETSQENVFAVGEIATGLHGSNRIGGTAIPEAVIFGRIAGEEAAQRDTDRDLNVEGTAGNSEITDDLRERFWDNLGPVRKRSEVKSLVKGLEDEDSLTSEEKLLLETGKSVLGRQKNIGSHYIE
ncbi:MAG: FAD-binding protein [Candidatus Nanohalobium sp.]